MFPKPRHGNLLVGERNNDSKFCEIRRNRRRPSNTVVLRNNLLSLSRLLFLCPEGGLVSNMLGLRPVVTVVAVGQVAKLVAVAVAKWVDAQYQGVRVYRRVVPKLCLVATKVMTCCHYRVKEKVWSNDGESTTKRWRTNASTMNGPVIARGEAPP